MTSQSDTPVSGTGVVHGEVLTRGWVVRLILDLAGYTTDSDLTRLRLVEPAAGTGAFAGPIVERLCESAAIHQVPVTPDTVGDAVRFYDIQPDNAVTLRETVAAVLAQFGVGVADRVALAALWVRCDDYLLPAAANRYTGVDVVVGNPPYIRLEDIPAGRAARYRAAYPAMTGRADIYIGFFEAALRALRPEGRLAYICADRWMRNDYGKGLRNLITTGGFAVDTVVTLHEADVFETQVDAYPAITVIRRGDQHPVAIADTTVKFTERQAGPLTDAVTKHRHKETSAYTVGVVDRWFEPGKAPWPAGTPATLERLAGWAHLPTIEQTGAKIGIGVATGADAVYVTKPGEPLPDVEAARLLPLSHADDVRAGEWNWRGRHLVNPWTADGLVDLADYPKLAAYYENADKIRGRNVAKRNPNSWWRTIDRVNYRLLDRPLIVFQDMSQQVTPVVVPAGFYPHHNLYWIDVNGSGWEPEVLAGLLLADQVRVQVAARCVLMRGRTLRLQAQYLRQVHIPAPADVSRDAAKEFKVAYLNGDRAKATETLASLIGK